MKRGRNAALSHAVALRRVAPREIIGIRDRMRGDSPLTGAYSAVRSMLPRARKRSVWQSRARVTHTAHFTQHHDYTRYYWRVAGDARRATPADYHTAQQRDTLGFAYAIWLAPRRAVGPVVLIKISSFHDYPPCRRNQWEHSPGRCQPACAT